MMMSRRALLAALVLCPMALQAQAGPGEQEAGTVNAGTTRLELVALDDGHVRAHVVGPREIATMTWSGGELRAWIDTGPHAARERLSRTARVHAPVGTARAVASSR
jgi:hypothetical protein